jgi:anti-sigma factor ChrR (cupin superfamily)
MSNSKAPEDQEVHELVASYALGAIEGAEKTAFEEHLRNCARCESELREFREVSAQIGASVPADPPAELRQRVLERARRTPRFPGVILEEQGLLIFRAAEVEWRDFAEGIQFKPLYMDSDRHYNTVLVRMAAGASIPAHRHQDVEEVFVLSGDLHVSGEVMVPGDYCRAVADSVHGTTFSETGCVFLVRAAQVDGVIA